MGMIKVAFPVTVEPSEDANCVVFNLGKDPRFIGYAVNSDGELVRCDFLKNDCQVIASGIVSLKAELTGADDSAVRFALVARNSEPDKEEVTTVQPTWKDGSAINVSGAPVPAGFTWQNYRYQVYETIVPLMNVQWRQ
jgi:hypothetical protein